MRCEEIMKRDVECLGLDDTVGQAAIRMRDTNIGFLPVCDEAGKVVGTLTDRDIAVRLVAAGDPPTTKANEIMSREVVSCRPADDISVAERLMGDHHKSRILCLDEDGALAGVISLSDIAQHEEGTRAAQTMRDVTAREARL